MILAVHNDSHQIRSEEAAPAVVMLPAVGNGRCRRNGGIPLCISGLMMRFQEASPQSKNPRRLLASGVF